jgi:hypothetical protein
VGAPSGAARRTAGHLGAAAAEAEMTEGLAKLVSDLRRSTHRPEFSALTQTVYRYVIVPSIRGTDSDGRREVPIGPAVR